MFVDSLGRVPQLDSFKDWDPLTEGEESDWENGGRFGTRQNCSNVTHLDISVGLQITASVMAAVGEDTVYQRVLQEVGARSKRGLRELPMDHPAQNLNQVWDSIGRLKMPNGEEMMILDSSRLFIPSGARQEILETLHIAHLGVAKMSSANKPREEMLQHGEFPTRLMSQIYLNIFFYRGQQYLHVMDLYSSFIFTRKMRCTPSTEMMTRTLESIFETFGFPELIFSDSGPQMRAPFTSWAEQLGIEHQVSSTYFASSNGAIERSLMFLDILVCNIFC